MAHEVRLDADEFPNPDLASFAERELENVREEVLKKKTPNLNGRDLVPQDTSINSWQERYVHQMYELLGTAEFVGDDVDDFPLAGQSLSEETFNIRKIGAAYKFSMDEMAKSEALGYGLDVKRAEAARRAHEELLNQIIFYGDEREDLFGLLNYPDTPRVVLANPIDSTTNPDVIKNMITDLLESIFKTTQNVAEPDTIWFPTDAFFHVVNTEHNPSGGGDSTILEWMQDKHPLVNDRVEVVQELDGAGPSGRDLMVVGRFGDEDSDEVLKHVLPQMFEQRSPQTRNEAVITNTVSKTGGVASDYPQEFLVAEIPA